MPIRKLAFIVLPAVGWAAATLAQPAPPAAAVRNVPETFFGTSVDDPYRHLEDLKSPETAAWMKAQAEHAEGVLARIPGRAALRARLAADDAAVPARAGDVVREDGSRWFHLERGAGDEQFKLVSRRTLEGAPQVLVDPQAAARRSGKPHAINYFAPAPGGRWVAYGISQQGSEDAVLRVVGAASGRHYGAPIDRAEYGALGWSADGRTLVFNRLQKLAPGADPAQRYLDSRVWAWRPGLPLATARPVFGRGMPGTALEPLDVPAVQMTHDGRWALGFAVRGTTNEKALYVSPAGALLAGAPRWRPVFDAGAGVTAVAYMGDALYLLSHQGAPRRKVLKLPIGAPLAQAQELVPAGERVITGLAAAADALYVESREGNTKRLHKLAWGTGPQDLRPVPLPVEGSFVLQDDEGGQSAANPRLPGLVLDLQGWTRARQVWLLRADGSARNTMLQPAGPRDAPADIVATEVLVPSHDGARVPLSIIHKKGVVLDGRNPLLLYGYASYGVTEEPYFSLSRLAWLDAGGVFAVANPRGSSVFGEDWYRGGFQASKPNSWKDFIACAQWLVDQRWTQPSRLAIWGVSAGGILVGRAMTERPDLFGAVVSQVGALDAVRSELSANGVTNVPEFGSRATEGGFRALLAMSTYHQIRAGVRYPAVLLTHGVNDPRVDVWESSKTAARLQAVAAGLPHGRPVLLRLDYEAGHGIGNTRAQDLAERADLFAFVLWQLGVEGYQPK